MDVGRAGDSRHNNGAFLCLILSHAEPVFAVPLPPSLLGCFPVPSGRRLRHLDVAALEQLRRGAPGKVSDKDGVFRPLCYTLGTLAKRH